MKLEFLFIHSYKNNTKILEELNNYILNYNYKKDLNIDFINGLFDSDG